MPGRMVEMSSSTSTNGINGVSVGGKDGTADSTVDGKSQYMTSTSIQSSGRESAIEGGAVNGITDDKSSIPIATTSQLEPSASTNGIKAVDSNVRTTATDASAPDPAPELLHITDGYIALGALIERVMQQSFVDFTNLVENNSQMPVLLPNATSGINGVGSLINGTTHPTIHQKNNSEKRIAWIEWARSNRDKFIKLLIIAQWAKANSKSIQMLIDLKRWSDTQDAGFYDSAVSIGQLKRDLFPFRLRNPDIKTALDILSIGKDSRMPDLDMLPNTSLTNEKMLQTLRNMNTLLRIRLNIHEDLPWHLRQWTVANGRATFSFPNEFEFDITIAEDDVTKQLYFVDLRFLFSPAPIIGDNRLRDIIQIRADESLSLSGVSGCFDFLHNLVLTHKITTLYEQATQLARTSWTGSLRIEMVHRWLIIEYWISDHYAKSWIEVGISSDVENIKQLPGHVPLPRLAARYRQFGKLVDSEELELGGGAIDVEAILKRVVARHSLNILRSTEQKLHDLIGSPNRIQTILEQSIDEPIDCRLRVRQGKHATEAVLSIEAVTGRLCLSPASEISGRAQFELNRLRNPADDAYITLERYLCLDQLSRLGRQAVINGWEPMRSIKLSLEYLTKKLQHRIVQLGAFRPTWWIGEGQNWALIVTLSLEGASWWAVEVLSSPDTDTLGDIHNVDSAFDQDCIGFDSFNNIERIGIRCLTLARTIRELRNVSVQVGIHWLKQAVSEQQRIVSRQDSKAVEEVPALTMPASEVVKTMSSMPKPHPQTFQLILGQYDAHTSKVTALVKGALPWTAQVSDMISTTFDPSVTFSSHGNFTLQLEAPIGASFHSPMIERLNLLVRATSFLTSLKAQSITPINSTISQITFHYPKADSTKDAAAITSAANNAQFSCRIVFSPDATSPPLIHFLPPSSNPHLRVRANLAQIFARKSASNFLSVLHLTLPLLRALQRVELRGNTIRYWSIMKYRIVYRAASTVFEIVCKAVGGTIEFHVYETRAGSNNANSNIIRPQGYEEMMREYFARSAPGIRSLKSMLVCDSDSIERAIDELDRLVRDKIASAPLVPQSAPQQPQQHPGTNPVAMNSGGNASGGQARPQFGAGRGGPPVNVAAQHQAQQRLQQQRLAQHHAQQRAAAAAANRAAQGSQVVVLD